MSPLTLVLILAGTLTSVTVIAVLAWFCYTAYLIWFERRLERRKGRYRSLVSQLAWGSGRWIPSCIGRKRCTI